MGHKLKVSAEKEKLANDVLDFINNYFKNPLQNENGVIAAINGEWGTGKTYFVENILINKIKENSNYKIKKINVWEKQKYKDPIFAFIDEEKFSEQLNINFKLAPLSYQLSSNCTIKSMFQSVDDLFREDNYVIIIDELDRCSPKYIFSFLEFIQHVSKMKCIIISLNLNVLDAICENIYGNLNEIYHEKIISRIFELPIYNEEVNYIFQEVIGEELPNNAMDIFKEVIKKYGYNNLRKVTNLANDYKVAEFIKNVYVDNNFESIRKGFESFMHESVELEVFVFLTQQL